GSKAASSPAENYHLARRRTLQVVVSALHDRAVVYESVGEGSRGDLLYKEIECRCCFNAESLPVYAKRSQRMVITAPPVTNLPVTPKALTAGHKRSHPSYIPSHFPEFPDPHTYIKTPTFREPVSDYQVLREKAASQRRDVERALTRFMAKTGETQSLFKDDITTFPRESAGGEKSIHVCTWWLLFKGICVSPVIAARPSSIPYLSALLPSELELQSLEET
ncbi:unnamed protein product, partial [Tetraodon nigroviridis]